MSLSDQLVSAQRDTRQEVKSLRQLTQRVARAEDESLRAVERKISETGRSLIAALREESEETRLLLYLGFKAVVERLDQQTETLQQMLDVLREPTRTEAREKQSDGVRSYRNGKQTANLRWLEDAVRDFSQAIEIDRKDFVSHWYLGLIFAFEFMDDSRAEASFREAAHYAWPENPTASACSLIGVALVLHANGRTPDAEEAAAEAVKRDPNLAIGHYHLAVYCLANGRPREAITNLRRAITLDPELFKAATVDPLLRACPGLDELLGQLLQEAKNKVESCLRRYEAFLDAAESVLRRWEPKSLARMAQERQRAQRIDADIRRGHYVELVRSETERETSRACQSLGDFVLSCLLRIRGPSQRPKPISVGEAIGALLRRLFFCWIGWGIAMLVFGIAVSAVYSNMGGSEEDAETSAMWIIGVGASLVALLLVVAAFWYTVSEYTQKRRASRDWDAVAEDIEGWRSSSLGGQAAALAVMSGQLDAWGGGRDFRYPRQPGDV